MSWHVGFSHGYVVWMLMLAGSGVSLNNQFFTN